MTRSVNIQTQIENIFKFLQNNLPSSLDHSICEIFGRLQTEIDGLNLELKHHLSWKVQFFKERIQDVSTQITQLFADKEAVAPAFLKVAKRIRVLTNCLLYTIDPRHSESAVDSTFIPLQPVENSPHTEHQVWTLLDKQMKAKNQVAIAAVVTSPSFLKLQPTQVMKIWNWALEENYLEVSEAVLQVFWIPREELEQFTLKVISQNQFSAIEEPVIGYRYEHLTTDLQQHIENQQTFLRLERAALADDPDVFELEYMDFLLLQPHQQEAIYATLFTKQPSRILERVLTLPLFLYQAPEQMQKLLILFLQNRRYQEVERWIQLSPATYQGCDASKILKYIPFSRHSSLRKLLNQPINRPFNLQAVQLRMLTACLIQAMKNNRWLKTIPPIVDGNDLKAHFDQIAGLVDLIPQEVKDPTASKIQECLRDLRKGVETFQSSTSRQTHTFDLFIIDFVKEIYTFRKPIFDHSESDAYESKENGTQASKPSSSLTQGANTIHSVLDSTFKRDDPEAFAMDCMILALLKKERLKHLFSLLPQSSRILDSLWVLQPILYGHPIIMWSILEILIENKRYIEVEKWMELPHFPYVEDKVLDIFSLLKGAPDPIEKLAYTKVDDYLSNRKPRTKPLEIEIRMLTAFLIQALINNGWIEKEVVLTPSTDIQDYISQIDQLLSRIPNEITHHSVIHTRDVDWPALKQAINTQQKDVDLDQIFGRLLQQISNFRRPIVC